MQTREHPAVLIIAGNDPSGGAGIQADIQAVSALGGHPAPVVTALTVQDTSNAREVRAMDGAFVARQAKAVLADLPVRAVKIGLLATPDIARAVAGVLAAAPDIPVVLDPVLFAAGGARLAENELKDVLLAELIPATTLVTPNAGEIRELCPGSRDNAVRARALLARGCGYVLVKGADERTPKVQNALYDSNGGERYYEWERLPHSYHGSGCTLASASAALLAHGCSVEDAVDLAQRYTDSALQHGYRPGRGQHVPDRLFRLPFDLR